jgi:uncharacterized membrane-anchored protein
MKICATTLGDLPLMTMDVGYVVSSLILMGLFLDTLSKILGAALGDFLADDSGLGIAGGAALIGGALVLVTLGYCHTPLSPVPLFWAAFVLTRLFGARLHPGGA